MTDTGHPDGGLSEGLSLGSSSSVPVRFLGPPVLLDAQLLHHLLLQGFQWGHVGLLQCVVRTGVLRPVCGGTKTKLVLNNVDKQGSEWGMSHCQLEKGIIWSERIRFMCYGRTFELLGIQTWKMWGGTSKASIYVTTPQAQSQSQRETLAEWGARQTMTVSQLSY